MDETAAAITFPDDHAMLRDPNFYLCDTGATIHTVRDDLGMKNIQKCINEKTTMGNGVEEEALKKRISGSQSGEIGETKSTQKRSHKIGKRFVCRYCDYSTNFKSHLTEHTRLHTGERPFRCGFCEKTFVKNSNKKTHERIHTGERPFSCRICDKTFKDSSNKNTHEKTHTKER